MLADLQIKVKYHVLIIVFFPGFQRPIQIFTKPETAQVTPQWSWNNTPNRSYQGSGPNTPWWEAMEAQHVAGILNPPIVTMSPLVESPLTTMSPTTEVTERTASPLVEDGELTRNLLAATCSVDTNTTSGIDSPADEGGGGGRRESRNATPKVKFMVGSSGFCTPCDSATQSPIPVYSQFLQQSSYRGEVRTDDDVTRAPQMTPTQEDSSASTMLRVQSAPGLLETAPFRQKKNVPHVGTAPGLLETSFCTDSCDSDCCSSVSQDSKSHKDCLPGAIEGSESPRRDTVTSSQPEEEMKSNNQSIGQTPNMNVNEAVNHTPSGSTDNVSHDPVSEPEVSSSSDIQLHHT